MSNQLYRDYVAFVDGDSIVPYHVDGAKYIIKPVDFHESFEFEFKHYYRYFNDYCVGIACSNFARPIYKDEYLKVKALFIKRNELNEVKVQKNTQLFFNFC